MIRLKTSAAAAALLILSGSAAIATPKVTLTASANHPSVEAGLRYLKLAEAALESGYHNFKDFGGHRDKAHTLTLQAIAETEKALQYSNH